MKNKISIVLNFIFLILFISCNQKVEIQYYDTGEIYVTKKRINEHETEARLYFKNAQIAQEGIVRDSLREGQWNYYYNDGVLLGELIFSKGELVKENIRYPITLDFKDNPSEFKTNKSYQFRALGVCTFTMKTSIQLDYKRIPMNDFNDILYQFEITPQRAGNDTIMVIITGFETDINKDTIFFPIKIVEGCEL